MTEDNFYQLTIASISDIHIGHKKTKTKDIVDGLYQAFPKNEETRKLDIIFFAGDVFDRLLEFPDDDVTSFNIWASDFIRMCARFDIKVRILEGTPSHDRGQSKIFETLAGIMQEPIDLAFVKTLSIEFIEDLNINILYVPDEWESSTAKTLEQVKTLIASKGLAKVDLAIMHGMFDYQLPPHLMKLQNHNSEEYLRLVKHYIFIGHVHNYTFYKRIIAQGSFDRLAHGEEAPKGHARAIIGSDGSREHFFIENYNAKIYKTIKCKSDDLKETLKLINKYTKDLPGNSNVRIEADSKHPIFTNFHELVQMFPTIVWTKHPKVKEEEVEQVLNEEYTDYVPITINKDNIVSLLMDRVNSNELTGALSSRCDALLREVK